MSKILHRIINPCQASLVEHQSLAASTPQDTHAPPCFEESSRQISPVCSQNCSGWVADYLVQIDLQKIMPKASKCTRALWREKRAQNCETMRLVVLYFFHHVGAIEIFDIVFELTGFAILHVRIAAGSQVSKPAFPKSCHGQGTVETSQE